MVTGAGNLPDPIRVWEVSRGGDLELIQKIELRPGTDQFEVDPFGRFVVVPRADSEASEIIVFSVLPDGRLAPAGSLTRRGWRFSNTEHALTPDGQLYITLSEQIATPRQAFLETFRITPDLEPVAVARLRISPEGPLNVWRPRGPLGVARTQSGAFTLLSASDTGGLSHISVLPITASGEFTGLAQQLNFRGIFPMEGWAVRADQRLMVTGSSITLPPISFQIGADGLLTVADLWDVDALGVWNIGALQFLPGGAKLINSNLLSRAPVTADGLFTEPPVFFPEAGVLLDAPPAITHCGRLAVTTWQFDSEGIHWGVFALDRPDDIPLIADHTRPDDFSDIAFIPPRTDQLLGDANADGRRDAADIVIYISHLAAAPIIAGPVPRARADADQDGKIDKSDLEWLVEFLLGI
jgi:hypothetical protein